jgi:hypothetical protein
MASNTRWRHSPVNRIGRSTFRTIYWTTALCLFLVLACISPCLMSIDPAALILLIFPTVVFCAWLVLGRPIARQLVPLLVSTLTCPGCAEEIDAVGLWSCGCGFRDFRERHILEGRCPMCGKAAGHISCPRCHTTIGLW